jgi:hypothetical protein
MEKLMPSCKRSILMVGAFAATTWALPAQAQEPCAKVVVDSPGYVECLHNVDVPIVFVAEASARNTGINHEMLIEIVATHQDTGAVFEGSTGWREQSDGRAKVSIDALGLYNVTASTKNMDGRANTLVITVEAN